MSEKVGGSKAKKVIFMLGGFFACGLVTFTFGLLIGRQITLAELKIAKNVPEEHGENHAAEGEGDAHQKEHAKADDKTDAKEETHKEEAHKEEAKVEAKAEAKAEEPKEEHAKGKTEAANESHGAEPKDDVKAQASKEDTDIKYEEVRPDGPKVEVENSKKVIDLSAQIAGIDTKEKGNPGDVKDLPPEVAKLFEEGQQKKLKREPSKLEPAKPKPQWTIQVGAFPNAEEAKTKIKLLESKGAKAHIEETVGKDKSLWYRVTVGQYMSLAEAQGEGKKLKDKGAIGAFFARKLE